jgi:hypothetical protein
MLLSYRNAEKPVTDAVERFKIDYFSVTFSWRTASLVQWSEFQATDPEIPGPIPGAARFS